jgi:hypothetical protein
VSQGAYDPLWRLLVNRAVDFIRRGLIGRAYRAAMRAIAGPLTGSELGQITRTANVGIAVAGAATQLEEDEPLSTALGGRNPPANAVEVEVRYRVVNAAGQEAWRTVRLPGPHAPDIQITWQTTHGQVVQLVREIEASQPWDYEAGEVDESKVNFEPPLWFPPMPT